MLRSHMAPSLWLLMARRGLLRDRLSLAEAVHGNWVTSYLDSMLHFPVSEQSGYQDLLEVGFQHIAPMRLLGEQTEEQALVICSPTTPKLLSLRGRVG